MALWLLVCLMLWIIFAILIGQVLSASPLDHSEWKPVLIIAASWLSVIALGWPVNGWLKSHMHALASRIEKYRWRSVPIRGRVVPLEELVLEFPDSDTPNATQELTEPYRGRVYTYSSIGSSKGNTRKKE